jgi:hypothetical protein
MGEAKRRRQGAHVMMGTRDERLQGLRQFQSDNKAAELFVARASDPRMLIGILTADQKTLRFVEIVRTTLRELERANPPMLCFNLACNYCFDKGKAPCTIIVVAPMMQNWVQDGGTAIIHGACPQCSAMTDDEICAMVMKAHNMRELPHIGTA